MQRWSRRKDSFMKICNNSEEPLKLKQIKHAGGTKELVVSLLELDFIQKKF